MVSDVRLERPLSTPSPFEDCVSPCSHNPTNPFAVFHTDTWVSATKEGPIASTVSNLAAPPRVASARSGASSDRWRKRWGHSPPAARSIPVLPQRLQTTLAPRHCAIAQRPLDARPLRPSRTYPSPNAHRAQHSPSHPRSRSEDSPSFSRGLEYPVLSKGQHHEKRILERKLA